MTPETGSRRKGGKQLGDLLVAETFGPTLQGEGPSAGHPAVFIRLSRCNLTCGRGRTARWACDTPYTWDWSRFSPDEESYPATAGELAAWARRHRTELVVISGGEPLLQQHGLTALVDALLTSGHRIEIETNGTIRPSEALLRDGVRLNVSPKPAGSGVDLGRRIVPDALRTLAASGRAVFKFVVTDPDELSEVAELVDAHALAPVWIMPEGTEAATVLERMERLADPVIAHGWQLTPRLHVLLWGDRRGR